MRLNKPIISLLLVIQFAITSCNVYLSNKYQILYASEDINHSSVIQIDSISFQNVYEVLSTFATENGLIKISANRAEHITDLDEKDGNILLAYIINDNSDYYKMILFTERKVITQLSHTKIQNYQYYIIFKSHLENDSKREDHRLFCNDFIKLYKERFGERSIKSYKENTLSIYEPL